MDNRFVTYKIFVEHAGVKAFTTSRHSLKSGRPRFTGPSGLNPLGNKLSLASLLGIDAGQLVFPAQTHSNRVAVISRISSEELKETDALITNKPNICLCIQTADCVPVLLYDPHRNVVAAIHAGWRGTVGLIVKRAIDRMTAQFDSDPKDILAAIGPSISQDRYEVGEEVVKEVLEKIPKPERSVIDCSYGKYRLDLWEANKQVLIMSGIPEHNIETSGFCTFNEPDKFFSARRDGIDTGRLVSGIMLENSLTG